MARRVTGCLGNARLRMAGVASMAWTRLASYGVAGEVGRGLESLRLARFVMAGWALRGRTGMESRGSSSSGGAGSRFAGESSLCQ